MAAAGPLGRSGGVRGRVRGRVPLLPRSHREGESASAAIMCCHAEWRCQSFVAWVAGCGPAAIPSLNMFAMSESMIAEQGPLRAVVWL